MTLLDLLGDWTDVPEWTPLFKPFGITLTSLVTGDRCRDCGTRAPSTQQGSADAIGIYAICDDCAQLDNCRTSNRGSEWHVSHWGDSHRTDEHDELVAARDKRRANFLRKAHAA
jgi:hypothetical protein